MSMLSAITTYNLCSTVTLLSIKWSICSSQSITRLSMTHLPAVQFVRKYYKFTPSFLENASQIENICFSSQGKLFICMLMISD